MRYILALIVALSAIPAHAVPMLESFPGSPNDIYLDCTTIPWDTTDEVITQTWNIMRYYFDQFNVNLRTTKPEPKPNVAYLLMGGPLRDGVLGYSGLNNWRLGTLVGSALAGYVLADGMNDNPLDCALVAAHETGHLVDLRHEDEGLMYYALIDNPQPQWTAFDIAYLSNPDVFGLRPVPESSIMAGVMLLAIGLTQQRQHR